FDGTSQKVPLTPALSPRAGRRRDPWRIGDAPPDRRTHACAERSGRGSRGRILAGFPRRTAEPDSRGLEPSIRGLQALILPRGRLCPRVARPYRTVNLARGLRRPRL